MTETRFRFILDQFPNLDKREKEILFYRFFGKMTFDKTAKVLKVTRERIRQIQMKALRKIGWYLHNDGRELPVRIDSLRKVLVAGLHPKMVKYYK